MSREAHVVSLTLPAPPHPNLPHPRLPSAPAGTLPPRSPHAWPLQLSLLASLPPNSSSSNAAIREKEPIPNRAQHPPPAPEPSSAPYSQGPLSSPALLLPTPGPEPIHFSGRRWVVLEQAPQPPFGFSALRATCQVPRYPVCRTPRKVLSIGEILRLSVLLFVQRLPSAPPHPPGEHELQASEEIPP